MGWSVTPEQSRRGKAAHSSATISAVQAESSGTSVSMLQVKSTHTGASRLPWQVRGLSQVGGVP
jgi:hypothetical protein